MTVPFVISMKLVGDATSGVAAVNEQAISLDRLNATIAGGSIPAAQRHAAALGTEAAAHRTAETAAELHSAALVRSTAVMRQASANRANLIFQLNDIGVSLASGMNPLLVAVQQGSQIATIYGPQQGGLGAALKETGNLALGLVTKLWPIAGVAAVAGVAIAGITNEINKTAETSVSMGDVVAAGFQLLGDSVTRELSPVFEWLGGIWDQITPYIVAGVNSTIGVFVFGYDTVKTIWTRLPAAMGEFAIGAANAVIGAIEGMINGSIDLLNGFIRDANGLLEPLGMSLGEGFGKVEFGKIENPLAGAGGDLLAQVRKDWDNAFGTDWVGEIGTRAEEIALQGVATAAGAANDNFKALASGGMADLEEASRRGREELDFYKGTFGSFFSDMKSGLQNGMSLWESFAGAASNALDSIADRALGMAADGIFDLIFGSIFGGLTGGLGTGFANPGNFSIGGMASYADGTSYHPGGLARVHGEEIIELPRGTRVHTAQSAASMGAANSNVVFQIIDQRSNGGSIQREERTGPNGEKIIRAIIRDEVRQATRRGAAGF